MNRDMSEEALDELLWRELKLDSRAPDHAFVAKVDRAVLEEARYERARAATRRRLFSDLAGLAALMASLLVLSLAPAMREALAGLDAWAWGGVAGLLLLWLATRRPAGDLG